MRSYVSGDRGAGQGTRRSRGRFLVWAGVLVFSGVGACGGVATERRELSASGASTGGGGSGPSARAGGAATNASGTGASQVGKPLGSSTAAGTGVGVGGASGDFDVGG